MARDSILKSPSKSKTSVFQNITHRKINEYLTIGDFNNFDNFMDQGRFKYIVSRILKVGMAFGEMGQKNNLRSETVVCNEECHFAIMSKNDYREILMEIEKIKRNNDFEFLKKTFLKDAPFISKDYYLQIIWKRRNETGESPQECFLIKKVK